ncbi:cbb3-type cytochrome c oxidase subunit I [Parapedobacter indicus]|uniref:Cytochrome c oxidase cbb3-type subunit 1 n=1 Tax=Parapedobacter indicus TaxID=1477437 RepID=A0A1I3M1F5_9SPHI|nr:cbb3-type cytochrome c oxidase subunit I [Parapedobacter indicus]PPL01317.1 cytochrome c oxidase cbb3-type subunit 1 [Parapedobacter indicus]SFI90620.1 cytochrome c oxidase cbb3-type subunit 1 [Parapedobacter indicus]
MEQMPNIYSLQLGWQEMTMVAFVVLLLVLLGVLLSLYHRVVHIRNNTGGGTDFRLKRHVEQFSSEQLEMLLQQKRRGTVKQKASPLSKKAVMFIAGLSAGLPAFAQETTASGIAWGNAGIVITLVLIGIPVLCGLVLMVIKIRRTLFRYQQRQNDALAGELAQYLDGLSDPEVLDNLAERKAALEYTLTHTELTGDVPVRDKRGLIASPRSDVNLPIAALKKRAVRRPNIDSQLAKLVLWYIGTSAFWLLFGTTVGQYLGIKFIAPDADQLSWLSFGRLRPVHTNAVFWGWASLGMLGLGHYIVPRVSNVPLASLRYGWYSLILINLTVLVGTVSLMAGINNGGGEYREYIWPIMLPFAVALALTLINFLKTIARRKTTEIYISNWYMISAIIFTIVIALVAYLPFWQNGLGEVIVQGYYMHQGVGMWFMLFTLGIVYYFLPQQLNKPIYSYSLGILAFWTQILFYTLIGTHHFIFSAIPWWLQTVAIVGSAGMVIPVVAGTTNFLLTFRGAWYKVKDSYTLPFFLAGIIFYFTGSLQGTAEAFRYTNLIWHFTDFTVAHSHLTMYGIISFLLWGSMYAVVPRLTGQEPPQLTVGAHFWFALIGLLFYTVPLMYGSTLKGLSWLEGKPFIDSVVLMAPYWLWRAIGGSLMWLSHLLFAYNLYKMFRTEPQSNIVETALAKLTDKTVSTAETR